MSSAEATSEGYSIQIPMPLESDHIPRQSHEQTPVAASPQLDAKGGVNENTPVEDLSSLKRKVYAYALRDMWQEAQPIFQKNPDMLRIALTANRDDTALDVAMSTRSTTFVEGLVNLMNPKDLRIGRKNTLEEDVILTEELQSGTANQYMNNSMDDETLHQEASHVILTEELQSGTANQCMDNSMDGDTLHQEASHFILTEELQSDTTYYSTDNSMDDDMLHQEASIHRIVASGAYKRPGNLDGKLAHIEELFFETIKNNTFGSALLLLKKFPTELGDLARYGNPCNYRNALNMLAQKPSVILNKVDREEKGKEGLQLLRQLYLAVREMERDLKTESSSTTSVLFSLVKSGNLEAVKCLTDNNSELLITIKDPSNGRNLLHHAVLCRQPSIVSYILELATNYFNTQGLRSSDPKSRKDNPILERDPREDNPLLERIDKEGNNVLHLAAQRRDFPRALRANVKMQNDLAWFKEIEKKCHEFKCTKMVNKNDKGKTPYEVFYDEHEDLSEEIKKDSKAIANSGMIVATLVATVAFAAALTVPGDKTNGWFVVFIFTNAIALFASAASILSFLSNFTSLRLAQSEFVKTLHPSLSVGRVLLFMSVVAMVVAFTAASFLIFDHTSKWVSYVAASMAVLTILLFILFRLRYFDDHLWCRSYRLSKFE